RRILHDLQSKHIPPLPQTLTQLIAKLKSLNPNHINPQKQSTLNPLFKPTKPSINQLFSRIQSLTSQIHPIT
ncbi:toxic anion resistance protein, partial [Staphylococcus epidermidis]|uniref:toxic anion resistance protein n=1 Tax=Staphylococcus epidermidis TaxID=1282 RepID=UPI0016425A71